MHDTITMPTNVSKESTKPGLDLNPDLHDSHDPLHQSPAWAFSNTGVNCHFVCGDATMHVLTGDLTIWIHLLQTDDRTKS
jgi:hypothetical protein